MSVDFFRDVVRRAEARRVPDVCIVGAGVRTPGHFTREAVELLRCCEVVYTIAPESGVAWFLREMGLRVETLVHLYEPGRLRRDIYQQAVATVLDATASVRPLGYVTSGHPMVLDRVVRGIRAGALERGLDVRVLPGISAIDTMLVDLGYDPGLSGLQVYEASWLVEHKIEPRVDVACLLFQPSAFGTAYAAVQHVPLPAALVPLRDYLLRWYPPHHEVALVRSAGVWYEQEEVCRTPLGDLPNVGGDEITGSTLFIPRLRAPEVDEAFAARARDRAYFQEVYRPVAGGGAAPDSDPRPVTANMPRESD